MAALRLILMLAIVGYAGWLAWPFVQEIMAGAEPGAVIAAETAQGWITPGLWLGAIVLYVVAALMLGAGNTRAAVAYFLGFVADAVLRLAISRSEPISADIAARSAEATEAAAPAGLPVDPTWLILGALLVVGLLIVAVSRRRRRHRQPGQLAA